MTTHTQGPWRQSNREGDHKRYIVANDADYGQSSGTVLIAEIKSHRLSSADRVPPDSIQSANARLIAAAPDLLAALTNLVGFLEANYDHNEVAMAACDEAVAAIAKAEGLGAEDMA